ncbi:hypothetical protein BUALT_Bualt13G0041800 [Buddleja alternifolia]|uniref:NAC domain-containing protein n=1 Tax=Buddleja alternifolia TaxID=168488 RepID=A0AAV6WRT7_9LAMI|nr:hypothetical protein BUALT_Bualt13G0039500 [Buddleja alternifolia]KAG8371002.1 hypothetical protein BUALT_Bualt13G0041800 [Buddleja alternifolia]
MASNQIPIGYRFLPNDDELITHYLKEKIRNETFRFDYIHDANVYEFNPQTLTGMFHNVGKDEYYFFTPRSRKYRNGNRPNREAGSGYWKATGADKPIRNNRREIIGFKKSLVFYEGKPPNHSKTNWIMHEYTVDQPTRNRRNEDNMRLDDWVLCGIHLRTTNRRELENIEIPPVDYGQEAAGAVWENNEIFLVDQAPNGNILEELASEDVDGVGYQYFTALDQAAPNLSDLV